MRPDYAEALNNRGNVLKELKRLDAALASYDRTLAAMPDHAHAFSGAADCVIMSHPDPPSTRQRKMEKLGDR